MRSGKRWSRPSRAVQEAHISFTVTLTDSDRVVGTFELERRSPGQVFRCL